MLNREFLPARDEEKSGQAPDLPVAQMIIRGRVISDDLIEISGRGGDLHFLTPDAKKYASELPLKHPSLLMDLYDLSFEDILAYLKELGECLDIENNLYLQQARELAYFTSPLTPSIIDFSYSQLKKYFDPDLIREVTDHQIGIKFLEGWVPHKMRDGKTFEVRCFGARTLHIIAGNAPLISAMTIVRNAVLRSDAIIKAPSNDPFTALAIARTMCEMAPDHPITKHLAVAYWQGGDVDLEEQLYQPRNIEKIVPWGGYSSVKHVARYVQPGLELVSFDPKRSASIVGAEALENEEIMKQAAVRIACDVGGLNQVACVNARVVYVVSGTNEDGIEKLVKLGRYVHDALLSLPQTISTKPRKFDPDLKAHIGSLKLDDEWFEVVGGDHDEGAVIVSKMSEAVDFAAKLNDRVVNLVPVDNLQDVVGAVNAYTQTVGIFPESLKKELINILPLYGAQRIVSLGYAINEMHATPQDAIEPSRRLGKWISNEISSPETVAPPWLSCTATVVDDEGRDCAPAERANLG